MEKLKKMNFYDVKKGLSITVFATSLMMLPLAECYSSDNPNNGNSVVTNTNSDTSKFTANIDKYWQNNDIDRLLKEEKNAPEDLVELRAKMLKGYGENKEISGKYDESLAAKTLSGIYVGKKDENNVVSWKGVPYAKQPVGNLRWKAPQKPDASDKVMEAYYFGKSSVQAEGTDEPSGLYPQGEECLNLNLWNNKSDNSNNKPIMVWIHGGAYIQGGANTDEYEGTNFVKNHSEVIYASIDYRTDFLGFINLSKVSGAESYTDTANLGLLDEIQALSWLKENAKAFGGDPERITIFGESAGGGSVSALTLAPQARGLFKRGIAQSGVVTAYLRSPEKSIERTGKIMEICGAKNLDDLLSLTVSDIRKIETILLEKDGVDYPYPQRDDIVIPMDLKAAISSDTRNGFDLMIGTTKDEYNYWNLLYGTERNKEITKDLIKSALANASDELKAKYDKFMSMQGKSEFENMLQFINYRSFHCPARYEIETHVANGQNTYVYYFTEEDKNPDILSCHGFDLGFVLGNVEKDRVKDLAKANKLSEIMQQMWINFAKTGDPSLKAGEVDGIGEIVWDKYQLKDGKVMVFDSEGTRQENDPLKEGSDLLMDMFFLRLKDN